MSRTICDKKFQKSFKKRARPVFNRFHDCGYNEILKRVKGV
jgi:hypothetical protein